MMSWGFLILALLLLTMVSTLYYALTRAMKDQVEVKKEFSEELCRLFTMLFVFTLTYALRFVGDYFVIPIALSSGLTKCYNLFIEQRFDCVKAIFIQYYLWSSVLYDFLPIALIAFFHFKSFRKTEETSDEFPSQVTGSLTGPTEHKTEAI